MMSVCWSGVAAAAADADASRRLCYHCYDWISTGTLLSKRSRQHRQRTTLDQSDRYEIGDRHMEKRVVGVESWSLGATGLGFSSLH